MLTKLLISVTEEIRSRCPGFGPQQVFLSLKCLSFEPPPDLIGDPIGSTIAQGFPAPLLAAQDSFAFPLSGRIPRFRAAGRLDRESARKMLEERPSGRWWAKSKVADLGCPCTVGLGFLTSVNPISSPRRCPRNFSKLGGPSGALDGFHRNV